MRQEPLALLLRADEQSFWASYARIYEAVLSRFAPHVALLGDLVEAVQDGRSVLDVGCGPGTLALRMARAGREVLGVDYNGRMLAYARSKERAGLCFRQMDACRLELPDNAFDAITSSNMLYFVPDPVAAVAEMGRVLRPGGTLALATPRRDCRIEVLDAALRAEVARQGDSELEGQLEEFFAFNAALGSGGLRNLFAPRELRDLLSSAAGLDEILVLRPCYLGQNTLVVARKAGGAR